MKKLIHLITLIFILLIACKRSQNASIYVEAEVISIPWNLVKSNAINEASNLIENDSFMEDIIEVNLVDSNLLRKISNYTTNNFYASDSIRSIDIRLVVLLTKKNNEGKDTLSFGNFHTKLNREFSTSERIIIEEILKKVDSGHLKIFKESIPPNSPSM